MVTVVVNGRQEVLSINIDPEVINPDDAEMLQDLIIAAVNEAISRAKTILRDKYSISKEGELTEVKHMKYKTSVSFQLKPSTVRLLKKWARQQGHENRSIVIERLCEALSQFDFECEGMLMWMRHGPTQKVLDLFIGEFGRETQEK